MSRYYFTVSSLPYLRFEDPPPLTIEAFHALCAPWLAPPDYRLVQNASISELSDTYPTCAVLQKWRQWEINLRNELVKTRAQKLGADPYEYLMPAARQAWETPSPWAATIGLVVSKKCISW